MRVGICTLGCKVNLYESEYVMNLFQKHGDEIVPFDEVCDVYVINTCTVTNTSSVKSRKMIKAAIRRNPEACVVAMGCFIEANQDYHADGLDIVLGTKEKGKIVSLVEEWFAKRSQIRHLWQERTTEFEDMLISRFEGRTRAFVKIQDGCDNFCSYCIIPYVRGKPRSKDPDKVMEEIKTLVQNGYQEVVLTGIHTGNYGRDLETDFATLLARIKQIEGLKRLRISSIEITELQDPVLKELEQSKLIVDHLHIPLQSGSDRILKLMNRKYDMAYFFDQVQKIRAIRPSIALTTDVIVGFPTETEEDFQEMVKNIQKIGFAKLHVFPYSKREGTVAAEMKQVDPKVKKERARRLLALSRELEQAYMEKFMGCEVDVLIERNKEGYSYGHTSHYLEAKIQGTIEPNTFYHGVVEKIEYPYIAVKATNDVSVTCEEMLV